MIKASLPLSFVFCLFAAAFAFDPAKADGMQAAQIKSILKLTQANWVAYRDYDGQQLIYFAHLESWKCGIASVRYGLNGQAPDQTWDLAECDEKNPNQVTKERPYLTFPLNHVQSIQVQLTFSDKSSSEIIEFTAP